MGGFPSAVAGAASRCRRTRVGLVKIAILNWRDLKHPQAGGAEVFVHEVAKVWTAEGHQVKVFSSNIAGRGSSECVDGVTIKRVGDLRTGSHHLTAPRSATASNPDVILESINTFPYQLPLRRGDLPPFVSLVHQMARNVWYSHLPFPLAWIAERLEPSLYRAYRNHPVLAVSKSTKSDLQASGLSDIIVVPQGGIGRQPLVEKEPVPTFIFVGRLAANKRPDHAIEAFRFIKAKIQDAKLWVVGDGGMQSMIRANLPVGAELLGRLPRDELFERMGRAHALLITSVREGWGLVVTEANALGTLAIAYDVPGIRDSVIHNGTGLLTSPQPRSLARAAVSLLARPTLYEELRASAIESGSGHLWKLSSEAVLKACCHAVDRSPTDISQV